MNKLFFGFTLLALFWPHPSQAFSFSPAEAEFNLSDKQLSRTFTVENTNDSKLAVQISAHVRAADEDGAETLPPTDHFSVFPKQVVLAPRESKAVRVTYVGPKTLEREAAYRVIAEQLPVDLKSIEPASGTKLKFLIKYQTSIYVVPPRAKPKIVVSSARLVEEKSAKQLELVFSNEGTAHRLLQNTKVTVKSGANSARPLPPETAKVLETVNVLAGSKRRVLLPWPKDLATQGAISAVVELD